MDEGNKEILLKAINLKESINNLMRAIINEDEKDIKYWQRSMKTWQGYFDKKLSRYLKKKEKEEKVPF